MQPVVLAASFLHPLYQGHQLTKEHLKKVNEFLLKNLEMSVLDQLANYKNKRGIFSKLFQKNIYSPIIF